MRAAIQLSTAADDHATAFAVSFTGAGNSFFAISAYMLDLGRAVRAITAGHLSKVIGVLCV